MKKPVLIGIVALVFVAAGLGIFLIASGDEETGLLGDVHEHADLRMYINSVPYDFAQEKYMLSGGKPLSSFMHFHDMDGEVIHKHASGITMGFFFNTLGMKFSQECLILDNGTEYCNGESNKLRMYVNGKPNNDFQNYEFRDIDRILITYGNESEEEIEQQIENVSDKSCIQSEKCPERGIPVDESSCATEGGCAAE